MTMSGEHQLGLPGVDHAPPGLIASAAPERAAGRSTGPEERRDAVVTAPEYIVVPIPNRELPESERRQAQPAEPPRRRRVGGRPRLPRRQVVMSVERSVFDLLRSASDRLGVSVSMLAGHGCGGGSGRSGAHHRCCAEGGRR